MAHGYKAVTWTPFKARYDRWILVGVIAYLAVFITATAMTAPPGESLHPVQLVIRATGTLAFGLLTLILLIGPAARLTRRALPFLYNRRHLGVTTFIIALVHAALTIMWYHGFSEVNPIASVFASNPRYDSLAGFPFESLGFVALIGLLIMAGTSHDFFNANLGPRVWKTLHMGVYVIYALLVAHVALGVIQTEKHPVYMGLLIGAAGVVTLAHLASGFFGSGPDRRAGPDAEADGWLRVAALEEMVENRGVVVEPGGAERIAVFRYDGKIAAVSNVCRHQGGPLGEGRVVDGCITCPWHGFQYRPEDGRSPEPFSERIATYATRLIDGVVYVNPAPNPPGTPTEPTLIAGAV